MDAVPVTCVKGAPWSAWLQVEPPPEPPTPTAPLALAKPVADVNALEPPTPDPQKAPLSETG
jgi:hypothetical protein